MHPLLTDIQDQFALDPAQFIGIPIAVVGAVFLSLGAQFQSRGVAKVEASTRVSASSGLNMRQLWSLLSRPSWVFGTLMLGLAVVFQLTSLGFSPLIVVQPLGVVALVMTAFLNARISKVNLDRKSILSIVLCVGGVFMFVLLAAFTARDRPITELQLIVILVILAVVLLAFGAGFIVYRTRMRAVAYIIGAGVLYGFVATLAKVVIKRLQQGDFEWLTVICVVGLLAAFAVGGYFVQTAYSSGPPDLVVAGLTVVDPLIAVGIGILVLGEASMAPWWAMIGYVITGVIAIVGVFGLAKYHPQIER
ncbi:DMT family transporter [Agreia sp. COWG]|uniref:DMT family transporter n=1 Tax=Agreia sp. COWG TaxID=2773266 RepID=UPI00192909B2|nr:DMT family transporter [Agreia sp. COWG]CAD5999610.1 Multidrug DMT transporter permease [Agreia sp. COWG]